MIRKLTLMIVAVMPLMLAAQIKIGVVDVKKIYEAMPGMTAALNKVQTASMQYQNELEEMRSEFQKKYTQYQALNANGGTPENIKELRVKELQELDQRIQQFVALAATSLQQIEDDAVNPLREKVLGAVREVGREEGFTMVYGNLNPQVEMLQSAGMEPLYMSDEVTDITERVMARLGIEVSQPEHEQSESK